MPGITKDAARDAVGCPPDPADVADADAELMAQPRQPTSLQGLLRFAMEATRAEDAPGASEVAPMEPEVGAVSICDCLFPKLTLSKAALR